MSLDTLSLTPWEYDALRLSLKAAFFGVAGALPLACALGILLARADFPGKTLLNGIIHLPLILPPVALGYLLLVVFGRRGVLGAPLHDWFGITIAFTWKGAALAAAVMSFPLIVRPIRLAVDAIDPGIDEVARSLGAGFARRLLTILLPLAAPGILAGAILGFARALGEFGATITFVASIPGETRTLPLALYAALERPDGADAAARLAALSLLIAGLALGASEVLARALRRRGSRR